MIKILVLGGGGERGNTIEAFGICFNKRNNMILLCKLRRKANIINIKEEGCSYILLKTKRIILKKNIIKREY